jgi:hypothetical protein
LVATAKDKFELPKFNGIDIPPLRKLSLRSPSFPSYFVFAIARPVSHASVPPAAIPGGAAAAANPAAAAFAINPQEHTKYHTLFVSYDKDQDG